MQDLGPGLFSPRLSVCVGEVQGLSLKFDGMRIYDWGFFRLRTLGLGDELGLALLRAPWHLGVVGVLDLGFGILVGGNHHNPTNYRHYCY